MALIVEDRVLELSTTVGVGPYTLSGSITGYRAFSAVCTNLDTFTYSAEDVDAYGRPTGAWETGLGTWGTGGIVTRTTIYSSSNANAAVSWTSGTRRISLGLLSNGVLKSLTLNAATGTSPITVSSTTKVVNLNADLLDGLDSTAFQPYSADLSAISGISATSGLLKKTASGAWTLDTSSYIISSSSITGASGSITSKDTRSVDSSPQSYNQAIYADFKANTTDGLSDGGSYHGVITFRQYGSGSDWSGGGVRQLGFTDNHNLWIRGANADTTWTSWKRIWDTASLTNLNQLINGPGYTSNVGTVTSVGGTGTVSGISLSGTVSSSGNLTLSGTLSVTPGNFASQTANTFLAAPEGVAGPPSFRTINISDIPTLNQNTTGTAAVATTLTGFTNSNSSTPIVGPDSVTNNGIGYVNTVNIFGQIDGALYSQAFSSSWVHQIFGDYRTGQIAIRGKNSNAWQSWRTVLDSTNFSTYAAPASHTHAYLSAETDTLATVTARGATSNGTIAIPAGVDLGYGFWGTYTNYSMLMGADVNTYQYGPVTDFSIKMSMGNGTGRGFTWGQYGAKPIAALNSTTGDMTIAGAFSAASKSFLIPHPLKEGVKLRHGSLEGPEHGVYIRGRIKTNKIELPDYWTELIDQDSITVQLTPIGSHQKLYVEKIENNTVFIINDNIFSSSIDCFYMINAERKDVSKLKVEEWV